MSEPGIREQLVGWWRLLNYRPLAEALDFDAAHDHAPHAEQLSP